MWISPPLQMFPQQIYFSISVMAVKSGVVSYFRNLGNYQAYSKKEHEQSLIP